MAGNAKIGALHVSLGLDSAQFAMGLKNASRGLNRFGVQLTLGLETIANVVGQVIGAMPEAIKGAIDHADALAKSAQKAGTTVEALSRLEYAAKLSDISLESMTGGLQKLGKSMSDAIITPTSTAAIAFKALGIEIKNADGTMRNSDQVLADIADRFSRMEDGSTKTALAMQMFGKSGAELIPLLNGGADGLKAMADESDRLGATISTKTAKAAEKFNDTLTTIGQIMQGVVNKVMEAALPALQGLADKLASPEFAQAAAQLATWVVNAMTAIVDAVTVATLKISEFGGEIKKWASIAAMISSGNFGGIVNFDRMQQIEQVQAAMGSGLRGQGWAGGFRRQPAEITVNGGSTTPLAPPAFGSGTKDALKAVNDEIAVMNKGLELQREDWEALQEPVRSVAGAMADTLGGMISAVMKGENAITSLADSFAQLGDQLIKMALNSAIQSFLGSLFGGGSGFGVGKGLTGAATYGFSGKGMYGIPSFDGGGFTGNGARSGGIDGQGGFLSVLHPNETISDHSSGGGKSVVELRMSRDVEARILQQSATQSVQITRSMAPSVVAKAGRDKVTR